MAAEWRFCSQAVKKRPRDMATAVTNKPPTKPIKVITPRWTWHRVRKYIHLACFAIFVILPFFDVMRFDIPRQRFYFAGQELWISEHRDQISAPIFMGIGGTLDVVSGRVKWAPALFRKTGTEWLYRLISEPKRWRRQLVLPKFLLLLLKQKFGLVNE